LNSVARQDVVRTLVEASKVDIVCLQEMKMANVSQRVLLAMLGTDFSCTLELPASGASGGILIAWRRAVEQLTSVELMHIVNRFSSDQKDNLGG
jgi:exonuclease III